MGVSIYYFYHGFGLKAFEGRHIRITHIYNHDIEKRQVSLMYFCTAKNMEEITSQPQVSGHLGYLKDLEISKYKREPKGR